jgi:hypothetical protein
MSVPGLFRSGRQFDLVSVGIFEEGDGVATASMFHGTGLAHDLNALSAKFIAGFVNVRHTERDVPETIADVIGVRIPIISKFDDCVGLFRTITDKDIGEPARRIFSFLQEFHTEPIAVEFQTLIEIIDSDHRVDDFHISPLLPNESVLAQILA